jgi:Outer membrane protein beta-barrel domain
MKKSMIVICTLLLCATVAAQTDKVKIGVKAGLNISSLTSNENELESTDKTGFTAGIMADISLAKNFSIQPEVVFSQQGMKFSYSDLDVKNSHYNSTIGLNYLNIPILLKYFIVKGLSVQVGPQIGILLKASNKYQDNFLGYENHETFNLSDYANGFDTSVNFGLGYQFKNKFYADLRYNISYSDIFKNASADTYIINSDMKNRVFQITFGYFFK